jgi:hypothetical protein
VLDAGLQRRDAQVASEIGAAFTYQRRAVRIGQSICGVDPGYGLLRTEVRRDFIRNKKSPDVSITRRDFDARNHGESQLALVNAAPCFDRASNLVMVCDGDDIQLG